MSAFAAGDRVRVRADWPEGRGVPVHIRTPAYLRGHAGIVERALGNFPNPEDLAFGRPAAARRLYRVVFPRRALWPGGAPADSVSADIYEHWLEAAP